MINDLNWQLISSSKGLPIPRDVHLWVAQWPPNAGVSLPKSMGLIEKFGPTVRNVTAALQKAG